MFSLCVQHPAPVECRLFFLLGIIFYNHVKTVMISGNCWELEINGGTELKISHQGNNDRELSECLRAPVSCCL